MVRRAITGASVFTGQDDRLHPDTTVIWQDSHLVWVGPDQEGDITDVDVVHQSGFVLPGLIDAHVHLCLDATIEGIQAVATEPIGVLRDRAARNAASLLICGITSVRDMGSREGVAVDVGESQQSGQLRGCRVVAAGRGITPTGGHGWMIGVCADGPNMVAAAVAGEIGRGAQTIKLFPTGGVLGSGSHGDQVTMTREEVSAAVEVAHAADVKVAAHVVGAPGVDVVLDSGVDTIEHAVGLTREQALRCLDDEVSLVPTLTAVEMLRRHLEELPADVRQRTEDVAMRHASGIISAIELGVTVLAGTDAGTPFNEPGSLVTELRLLADLGLGSAGAIRAATEQPARVLGLADRGRLSPGQSADILVVEEDPLADLGALSRPALIIQDGDVVSGGADA